MHRIKRRNPGGVRASSAPSPARTMDDVLTERVEQILPGFAQNDWGHEGNHEHVDHEQLVSLLWDLSRASRRAYNRPDEAPMLFDTDGRPAPALTEGLASALVARRLLDRLVGVMKGWTTTTRIYNRESALENRARPYRRTVADEAIAYTSNRREATRLHRRDPDRSVTDFLKDLVKERFRRDPGIQALLDPPIDWTRAANDRDEWLAASGEDTGPPRAWAVTGTGDMGRLTHEEIKQPTRQEMILLGLVEAQIREFEPSRLDRRVKPSEDLVSDESTSTKIRRSLGLTVRSRRRPRR